MIDPKYLRTHLPHIAQQLARRGYQLDQKTITTLEAERRELQIKLQTLQNQRNTASKAIGQTKAQGKPIQDLVAALDKLGDTLKTTQNHLNQTLTSLNDIYAGIPNLLDDSVPDGQTDADNQEIRRVGQPNQFDFTPKDHIALTESGGMDFKAAAMLSGSRFVILSGKTAWLHRALGQFMLDLHTREHGYEEKYVPYLLNPQALFGTGQLPKFAEDQFLIAGDRPLYLAPTAEVALTNLMRDRIVSDEELPLKWVAHTPCFRREAGSYGKDTQGMIRQHQFDKVELVQIVHPDQADQALEAITQHAETVLQRLELPYRVVNLCSGDVGFAARKTYDLEVWLPGQQCYREISSCSHFGDFQARRLKARWRDSGDQSIHLVHTLNGSGLAVGRTLIAVLENYQQADGSIRIPEALKPYMPPK